MARVLRYYQICTAHSIDREILNGDNGLLFHLCGLCCEMGIVPGNGFKDGKEFSLQKFFNAIELLATWKNICTVLSQGK